MRHYLILRTTVTDPDAPSPAPVKKPCRRAFWLIDVGSYNGLAFCTYLGLACFARVISNKPWPSFESYSRSAIVRQSSEQLSIIRQVTVCRTTNVILANHQDNLILGPQQTTLNGKPRRPDPWRCSMSQSLDHVARQNANCAEGNRTSE